MIGLYPPLALIVNRIRPVSMQKAENVLDRGWVTRWPVTRMTCHKTVYSTAKWASFPTTFSSHPALSASFWPPV